MTRGGGKLKERDPLFELVLKWITVPEWDMTMTLREAILKCENLIDQHLELRGAAGSGIPRAKSSNGTAEHNGNGGAKPAHQSGTSSELEAGCPGIGGFFTRLPLIKALNTLSAKNPVEQRRYVPPTLSEIRQVFNMAQVYELPGRVRMLTFDADDTLYEHGMDLQREDWIVTALLTLMEQGIYVAVVTAAGYPGKPLRYESRFKGLLELMVERKTSKEVASMFYCMGGECNYLFRLTHPEEGVYKMEGVPEEEWATPEILSWKETDIARLLDIAEGALKEACTTMRLQVQFVRKPRAVGAFPTRAEDRIAYEVLEDIALRVQDHVENHADGKVNIPFCAFNGNRDVWVDVGDKRIGIEALQQYIGISSVNTCHIGDRFTSTGNDLRSRDVAMTVWVTDPFETEQYLEVLLRALGDKCKECADARPTGPKQGTEEWKKAQTIQRNTAAT
mmetsp:Transcript_37183/g.87944  ORF Transcript_37183/g.87944 Transcript_37183/m.87944 type:complete len:449 (+) Transcript_37183:144-1490(+)